MPTAWSRAILHVDLDAFYTSVHQRDDESLRGKPIAVAGSSRRSVVMAASYEARVFGVHSAMPLFEALELCPDLIVVRPAGSRYREASRAVHAIFRRFAAPEKIEGLALDEAYIDVPLTASIGVAAGKVVAKVASASRKPDGLVVVPPDTEAAFMAAMPVGVLPGVGPKTEDRLRMMGVRRIGDLADYDTQRLVQSLGTGAAILQKLAQGK